MKSEREKQIFYSIIYMWNLEKWYKWTYLQSRNRERIYGYHGEKVGRGWIERLGLTHIHSACVLAKSLQSCPTLCDPMDSSPPGSFVHVILQGRIVEGVAIPSSRGSSQYIHCMRAKSLQSLSDSLRSHGQQPPRFLCPWNSPDKNTGVGCHDPLQGIFLTQGLNRVSWIARQILYHLSHQGPQGNYTLIKAKSLGQTRLFLKFRTDSVFSLFIRLDLEPRNIYIFFEPRNISS